MSWIFNNPFVFCFLLIVAMVFFSPCIYLRSPFLIIVAFVTNFFTAHVVCLNIRSTFGVQRSLAGPFSFGKFCNKIFVFYRAVNLRFLSMMFWNFLKANCFCNSIITKWKILSSHFSKKFFRKFQKFSTKHWETTV